MWEPLHPLIRIIQRAPAHYPCDPNVPGVNQLHLPRFFWTNAIPDADAAVNLDINGTRVAFGGIGYHDKNWGDRSILQSPKFWDWGHSRIGPYSVVWYDLLDYDDREYHRSYVAKDGEIDTLSCAEKSAVTRPWGVNATWPPTGGLTSIPGVVTTFQLSDGQQLVLNVTKDVVTYDKLVYTRATASVQAELTGTGETFSGRGFFDEFTYGLLDFS